MDAFWAFSWIWIPIVAILAGTFKEWLKFKENQRQLGSSTKDLEETVAALKQALQAAEGREQALVGRIQNLEAIVTNETWDALHDPALPEPARESRSALPEEEPDYAKVERIARRLRG